MVHACPPLKPLEETLDDGPCDSEDLPKFEKLFKNPWWDSYRFALDRTLQHNQTELLGQPVCMVMVVSTEDKDPLARFEELSNPHFLPEVFKTGQYDASSIQKFYLLVHEKSSSVDLQLIESQLKSVMPSNKCYLLDLSNDFDSSDVPNKEQEQKEHEKYFQAVLKNKPFFSAKTPQTVPYIGCNLTAMDIDTIKTCLSSLIRNGIIGSIEQRLFSMDHRITQNRKGFRNTISRYWRKSNKETGTPPRGNTPDISKVDRTSSPFQAGKVKYLHDSIESQVRALADLAFMVQDYDYAQNTYRLARDDFGSDKAYLFQASALKMMAVCALKKSGNNSRDVIDYLKRGIASLNEAMKSARLIADPVEREIQVKTIARFTTHVSIFFVDVISFQSSPRAYSTATELLAKASLEETSLCAAMVLEQTGRLLVLQELAYFVPGLSSTTPVSSRIRKFGFHMVMASLLFNKCGHIEHSLRCLATIRNLYKGSNWVHIVDHVDVSIGEYATAILQHKVALEFWVGILSRGDLPADQQAAILEDVFNHLRAIFSSFNSTEENNTIYRFDLPVIDDQQVVVRCHDNASVPLELPGSRIVVNEDGKKMTHKAAAAKDVEEWNNLKFELENRSTMKRHIVNKWTEVDECSIDTMIVVDVPITNPSAVDIQLCKVKLEAELIDSKGARHTTGFEMEEIAVVDLRANTCTWVRLNVVPKMEGQLCITGATWRFMGYAKVKHHFNIIGGKLNDTKENRVSGAREQDKRLQRTIRPRSAWLGVELSFESSGPFHEGEILRGDLQVINLGSVACSGALMIATSHSVTCIGSTLCEDPLEIVDGKDVAPSMDEEGKVFKVQLEGGELSTGLPVSVPVFLRMMHSATVKMMVMYTDVQGKKNFVKVSTTLVLSPAIKLASRVYLSGSSFLLACSITNQSSNSTIAINRISAVSGTWNLISGIEKQCELAPKSQRTFIFDLGRKSIPEIEKNLIKLHFMELENAASILQSRSQSSLKLSKMKDRLESQGKLPISIQEIRRANTQDSKQPASILDELERNSKSQQGEPRPTDYSALFWRGRSKLLHLMLHWQLDSERHGILNNLNVKVCPDNPLSLTLDYPTLVCVRRLAVRVVVENISEDAVAAGAVLEVHPGVKFSWIGRTRSCLPQLLPGEKYEVHLEIMLHSTGMIDIGKFKLVIDSTRIFEYRTKSSVIAMPSTLSTDTLSNHDSFDELSSDRLTKCGEIVKSILIPCPPLFSDVPPLPSRSPPASVTFESFSQNICDDSIAADQRGIPKEEEITTNVDDGAAMQEGISKVDVSIPATKVDISKVDNSITAMQRDILRYEDSAASTKKDISKVNDSTAPKVGFLKYDDSIPATKDDISKVDISIPAPKEEILKVDDSTAPTKEDISKVDDSTAPTKVDFLKVDDSETSAVQEDISKQVGSTAAVQRDISNEERYLTKSSSTEMLEEELRNLSSDDDDDDENFLEELAKELEDDN